MPAITYNDFKGGWDLRRSRNQSHANTLRTAENVFINAGGAIQQRPGLSSLESVDANSHGLFSAQGVLNCFYSLSHAGALTDTSNIKYHNIEHFLDVPGSDLDTVLSCKTFAGYLYVVAKFTDGETYHFYLNAEQFPVWQASTSYHTDGGDFDKVYGSDQVRPTNGDDKIFTIAKIAGDYVSGGTEPTWPDANHVAVADGACQWFLAGPAVLDSNCPHGEQVVFLGEHVFSLPKVTMVDGAATGDNVIRFSAAGNARDWTTSNDAGFLPVGRHAMGSDIPTALGIYRGDLVVFFSDSAQVWNIDPDPANMYLKQSIDSVGTTDPYSVANLSGDLFFRTKSGFRSISLVSYSESLQDVDIGAQINSERPSNNNPRAIYYSGGGQYLCTDYDEVYVYSFSRVSKISAWSLWTFENDKPITDFAQLDEVLYVRIGDFVKYFDEERTIDKGSAGEANYEYPVVIELPRLDFKTPGVDKQIFSMDHDVAGRCDISFLYGYRDDYSPDDGVYNSLETVPMEIRNDSYQARNIPVEMLATEIAPVFRTQSGDRPLIIHGITFYYENGVVT